MKDAEFDLSAYELSDTTEFTPRNAKGDGDLLGNDGQKVVFVLYGHGSDVAQKLSRKSDLRAQARMKVLMSGRTDSDAAEKAQKEELERLCELTKSISPNFETDPVKVYGHPKLVYIKNQVEAILRDTANFSKG